MWKAPGASSLLSWEKGPMADPSEQQGLETSLKTAVQSSFVLKQRKDKYLEVQILRRRKNKAVHPMVIARLSRLPRKLMPRIFKGFTGRQMTKTISGTLTNKWNFVTPGQDSSLLFQTGTTSSQCLWYSIQNPGNTVIKLMTPSGHFPHRGLL